MFVWGDEGNLFMMIVEIIVIVIISTVFSQLINFFIRRFERKYDLDLTVSNALKHLVLILVYAFMVIAILGVFGIDLMAILVSLGVFGIVAGFAARDTLANILGGISILFNRSIRFNDRIEISGCEGIVKDINLIFTILLTDDHKTINVPNRLFTNNVYVNFTKAEYRRVDILIFLPYPISIMDFRGVFDEKVNGYEWIVKSRGSQLLVLSTGDGGVNIKASVWIDKVNDVTKYRSILGEDISNIINKKLGV